MFCPSIYFKKLFGLPLNVSLLLIFHVITNAAVNEISREIKGFRCWLSINRIVVSTKKPEAPANIKYFISFRKGPLLIIFFKIHPVLMIY